MTNEEIKKSGSVLSISYYVEGIEEDNIDIDESIQSWRESSALFNKEVSSLLDLINNG